MQCEYCDLLIWVPKYKYVLSMCEVWKRLVLDIRKDEWLRGPTRANARYGQNWRNDTDLHRKSLEVDSVFRTPLVLFSPVEAHLAQFILMVTGERTPSHNWDSIHRSQEREKKRWFDKQYRFLTDIRFMSFNLSMTKKSKTSYDYLWTLSKGYPKMKVLSLLTHSHVPNIIYYPLLINQ